MGWKSRSREFRYLEGIRFPTLKKPRDLSKYIHLSVCVCVCVCVCVNMCVCVCVCVLSEECGYEKIICKLLSFTLCKLHCFEDREEKWEKNAAG